MLKAQNSIRILRIFFGFLFCLIVVSGCPESDPVPGPSWNWTVSTEFGRQPKWSPDGDRIVFGDDRPGFAGLYIWDTETDPVRLTDSAHFHNWDYCWSPDGELIAFTTPGEDSDSLSGIWILDVSSREISHVLEYGRDVSWYGSGQELVVRFDNPPEGEPGIYRLTLSEEKNAVTETTLVAVSGHKPVCSPGNNWLAYSDNEIDGRLHLIDSLGTEQYVGWHGVRQWTWSADGTFISFIINNYTTGILESVLWGLHINDPSAPDSLTRMAASPAPNSNGDEIAYSRLENGHWAGLWMYSDSEGIEKIATLGLNPDFNPKFDKIAANASTGGIRISVRE